MKPTFVLLFVTVALIGATGMVAADGGQNQPRWPGEDTATENNSTTTGVTPGQQLAGAVGAQGASVEGDLWNRTLSGRLTNATTPAERAAVVTDEVESLETYLEALESVRGNITEAWDDGELSEGEYRASLSEFVIRARTVELRANQTARAAEDLPGRTRETHDINATHVWGLGEQARDLYRFEGEIGREVANETLTNQSVESQIPNGEASKDGNGERNSP
jgi:hypothetical protein